MKAVKFNRGISSILIPAMILFISQPAFAYSKSEIINHKSEIFKNPFKYSGCYQDAESGMYYLNARYYSPELMRFISRDTYDLSNRYAYCDGDPISNADPTGHMPGFISTAINTYKSLPGWGQFALCWVGGEIALNAVGLAVGGVSFGGYKLAARGGEKTLGEAAGSATEELGQVSSLHEYTPCFKNVEKIPELHNQIVSDTKYYTTETASITDYKRVQCLVKGKETFINANKTEQTLTAEFAALTDNQRMAVHQSSKIVDAAIKGSYQVPLANEGIKISTLEYYNEALTEYTTIVDERIKIVTKFEKCVPSYEVNYVGSKKTSGKNNLAEAVVAEAKRIISQLKA